LNAIYHAMRGYFAGLKFNMSGLSLVSDMSVSCFLAGGEMVNLMWMVGGFRSLEDFVRECDSNKGLHPRVIDLMNEAFKSSKVSLRHIGKCHMILLCDCLICIIFRPLEKGEMYWSSIKQSGFIF
jgi:hypothetical protein